MDLLCEAKPRHFSDGSVLALAAKPCFKIKSIQYLSRKNTILPDPQYVNPTPRYQM